MNPIAIGVIVVVLAIAGWLIWQRQRTRQLQARYGHEYSRAVDELGRRRAEAELLSRERRVEQLKIRPLTAEQRDRFAKEWQRVQAKFVDDPAGAVTEGDRLVEEVMKTQGYPIAEFEQRAADLSVHHPRVVDNYRAARVIAERHSKGAASTEDLRRAMVYHRELFQDLLVDLEHPIERAAERAADTQVAREERVESTSGRPNGRQPTDREVRP